MVLSELLKTSLSSIIANKLRSFLTMLGIIIGVGAVIIMVSIGEGAKKQITDSIQSLGTNLLTISPSYARHGSVRTGSVENLVLEDAEIIRNSIPGISRVSAESTQNAQIQYFNKNLNSTIVGTVPDYLFVRNSKINMGRFIEDMDNRLLNRVCVLGWNVYEDLFEGGYPIGQMVKIRGINFEVIGVLEEKGQAGWANPDDQVVIPLMTFQRRVFGTNNLRFITVSVTEENLMSQVSDEIGTLLRIRHRLTDNQEDDFRIRNQAEMLETMEGITKTFTYLLGGVAAVSLLVGGIGIMNIMLVSVTERTREIGIRKALGAKKRDILIQFIFESVTMSLAGGLLGVLTGLYVSDVIPDLTNGQFQTYVTTGSIIISFLFAFAVGIFFGIYPAAKAAKLNPIDALRYE
jgi:putative ABC transport system permease protein